MSEASLCGKIVIRGTLFLDSPLVIRGGETPECPLHEVDAYVLRNEEGYPYIPGTSLAGVLRATLQKQGDSHSEGMVRLLFGHTNQHDQEEKEEEFQSMVDVSDVLLEEKTSGWRDGIAIHSFTGTAEEEKKYDYEVVERGNRGNMEIIITLRKHNLGEKGKLLPVLRQGIDSLLGSLSAGIRIGAYTAKGFGIVSSKDVAAVYYDFRKKDHIAAWLEYNPEIDITEWAESAVRCGCKIRKGKDVIEDDRLAISIDAFFDLESSILIGDGRMSGNEKNPAVSKESYLLPGTSIKGTLRHHSEKILRQFQRSASLLNDMMGFAANDVDKGDVSSNDGKKSRFIVKEVYIPPEKVVKEGQVRNRIDRFTGGTIGTALFSENSLWQKNKQDAPIHLHLALEKCHDGSIESWEIGLTLFLLRDMWQGRVAFGSGKSIGRGRLRGRSADICICAKDKSPECYHLDAKGFDLTDVEKKAIEYYAESFYAKMHEKEVMES